MTTHEIVPGIEGSALALSEVLLAGGETSSIGSPEHDSLVYVFAGSGVLAANGATWPVASGAAGLILAGEEGQLEAVEGEVAALVATVGPDADRHAPIGARGTVVRLNHSGSEQATGSRSYQVLLGPHNGSTRATLFAGYIPPGKAPWHYHLYDEIVWVFRGNGALHLGETAEDLAAGSAFRLTPREVHIVENRQEHAELAVLGLFTPAGSPSAAYLPPGTAGAYAFAGTD